MFSRQTLVGSNISTVKSHNMRAILLAMLHHEHVSRARLAELTGLSTTTITNLVSELLEQGAVIESGAEEDGLSRRGVGRPRRPLQLEPNAGYAVGVHIGIGNIRVAIANLRAQVVADGTLSYDIAASPSSQQYRPC